MHSIRYTKETMHTQEVYSGGSKMEWDIHETETYPTFPALRYHWY